jgi:hypothetical protein
MIKKVAALTDGLFVDNRRHHETTASDPGRIDNKAMHTNQFYQTSLTSTLQGVKLRKIKELVIRVATTFGLKRVGATARAD